MRRLVVTGLVTCLVLALGAVAYNMGRRSSGSAVSGPVAAATVPTSAYAYDARDDLSQLWARLATRGARLETDAATGLYRAARGSDRIVFGVDQAGALRFYSFEGGPGVDFMDSAVLMGKAFPPGKAVPVLDPLLGAFQATDTVDRVILGWRVYIRPEGLRRVVRLERQ